jgi:3-hydroxyisobutyrate dehydrogenase-like beta-hydroxyacid dehydrogenase
VKVAFIGLGNMGRHMARNLLRAKHDVTVWNRTLAKAEEHRALGARVAKSPGEAAKEAEAVITMLADDAAVESAVLHSGGVMESLPAKSAHISMSTISVALSKKLTEEHHKRGHKYITAPVFGRPEAAEAAKLFVAVAGDSDAVEYCKPLLEAMGQRVFVMGDKPEMANVVKLSGNFLIASVIECLGEAIALARKYGVDPHQYVEFLTNSLFAAPVYKTYGGLIADEKYRPAGFKIRLGLKDLKLALAAAESVDTPLPVGSMIRDHLLTAIARGMEDMDWSATAKLAAENAGLK